MTKTLESARRPIIKEDVLHNHIAETYFRQKTRAKPKKKKRTLIPKIEVLRIVTAAAIITALSLFAVMATTFLHNRYIDMLQKKTSSLKVINVISQGSINKTIIRRFELRGYAKRGKNKLVKDAVILTSPRKYNWADAAIDFKFPLDLSSRSILLSMAGSVGGEKINLVLRDKDNKSYRLSDISLSSKVREKVILPEGLKSELDLSRINHIRIEYGHPGEPAGQTDSPIGVTVYMSNLSLVKEG